MEMGQTPRTSSLAASGASRKSVLTNPFPDQAAMGFASLCLMHCLLLPSLGALLPLIGAVSEAEWLHKSFVLLALPISLWAVVTRLRSKGGLIFAGFVAIALGLLLSALRFEDLEVPLTVAGGVLLFGSHLTWWLTHRSS